MNVGTNAVVGLDVELWDLWGNALDRSDGETRYLHGGYGNIFDPVERALEGKAIGDTVEVRLEPEDAFGEYDDALVRIEPLESLAEGIEVGMLVEEDDAIFAVTDIADGIAVLDGNHPYAGIGLKVRCTVRSIRAATADEVEAGDAHDPGDSLVRVGP